MRPRFTYALTFVNYRGEVVTHSDLSRTTVVALLRMLRHNGDPAARAEVALVGRSGAGTRGARGWTWAGRTAADAAALIGERAARHGLQAPSGFYVPEERA